MGREIQFANAWMNPGCRGRENRAILTGVDSNGTSLSRNTAL